MNSVPVASNKMPFTVFYLFMRPVFYSSYQFLIDTVLFVLPIFLIHAASFSFMLPSSYLSCQVLIHAANFLFYFPVSYSCCQFYIIFNCSCQFLIDASCCHSFLIDVGIMYFADSRTDLEAIYNNKSRHCPTLLTLETALLSYSCW